MFWKEEWRVPRLTTPVSRSQASNVDVPVALPLPATGLHQPPTFPTSSFPRKKPLGYSRSFLLFHLLHPLLLARLVLSSHSAEPRGCPVLVAARATSCPTRGEEHSLSCGVNILRLGLCPHCDIKAPHKRSGAIRRHTTTDVQVGLKPPSTPSGPWVLACSRKDRG